MSKAKTSVPAASYQTASPTMVSTQNAIYILNNKIQKLEEVLKMQMTDIEQKLGDQESYVTDNIPDMDLINKAIACINNRLLDVDALEARVLALERAAPPTSPTPTLSLSPPVPAPPKKKGGTVKLAEMTQPPKEEPGISFT